MCVSRIALIVLSALLLCSAQLNVHYSRSDTCKVIADSFNCVTSMTHFAFLLQSDHTCEYVYSLKMDQFAVHEAHDQPMTLTATVQITCESSKLKCIFSPHDCLTISLKILLTVLSCL